MFFTPVSRSVHREGVYPSMHWGKHPPPPGQTHPSMHWDRPPMADISQHALGQTPPTPTATAEDGTHHTGMHSCLLYY